MLITHFILANKLRNGQPENEVDQIPSVDLDLKIE